MTDLFRNHIPVFCTARAQMPWAARTDTQAGATQQGLGINKQRGFVPSNL